MSGGFSRRSFLKVSAWAAGAAMARGAFAADGAPIQGFEDIQEVNALKNLTSGVNYFVSSSTFIIAGAISWPHTMVILVAAMFGGYLGANFARRLPAIWLKRVVITVGASLTVIYFIKTYF